MKIIDIDSFTVFAYDFCEEGIGYMEQHELAWKLFQQALFTCYEIRLEEQEICEEEKGKPYFANRCVEFNVTHTKGLVACVICGNSRVGIDAEWICEKPEKVSKKFMTPGELQGYEALSGEEKKEYFFRIWTLKEALAKAYGCGITKEFGYPEFTLSHPPICTDDRFWYHQWRISESDKAYIISIAMEK